MLSFPGKEKFDEQKRGFFVSSFDSKDRISKRNAKKNRLSVNSPPIRKEKVKQAIRKKQNGEYDSEEVYRKIADKLIDLFGI
jgi:anti-sigma28 factor (negative regulator of flagellin synthesis)